MRKMHDEAQHTRDHTNSTRPPAQEVDSSKLYDDQLWARRAIALARAGHLNEALHLLEEGLTYSLGSPSPERFNLLRSFYGLTLALARNESARGRMLCEEALTEYPWNAEMYCNLARVYVQSGRRDLAVETITTGMTLDRNDRQLIELGSKLGVRQPPPFRFLDRSNPINKFVGKLRHRLTAARDAANPTALADQTHA